jgi:hypothetical protein
VERSPAAVFGKGQTEVDTLTLVEDAFHGCFERRVPHVIPDAERITGSDARHEYAISARLTKRAEVQMVDGSLRVVSCLVDTHLFLLTGSFRQYRFALEYRIARLIDDLETLDWRIGAAVFAFPVHAHVEGIVRALERVVGTVACVDSVYGDTAHLTGADGCIAPCVALC